MDKDKELYALKIRHVLSYFTNDIEEITADDSSNTQTEKLQITFEEINRVVNETPEEAQKVENINENPELKWNLKSFSENPNLTLQIILDNPDKAWNWMYISANSNILRFAPNDKSTKLISQWRAANVIKKRWFKCITDPRYWICKKRLTCEFANI